MTLRELHEAVLSGAPSRAVWVRRLRLNGSELPDPKYGEALFPVGSETPEHTTWA